MPCQSSRISQILRTDRVVSTIEVSLSQSCVISFHLFSIETLTSFCAFFSTSAVLMVNFHTNTNTMTSNRKLQFLLETKLSSDDKVPKTGRLLRNKIFVIGFPPNVGGPFPIFDRSCRLPRPPCLVYRNRFGSVLLQFWSSSRNSHRQR